MKNYKTRPSSVKPAPIKAHKRQLFVLAGVFLVIVAFFPSNASAEIQEFNISDGRFKSIRESISTVKDAVKEKEVTIKVKQEEIKKIVETKEVLAVEVLTAKQEVEALQAKVAEKNRRTVQIAGFAPNSSGNTYVGGNCTWYAKSKRPDLPNRMGNARHWYNAAQRAGFNVGTESRKGAIGVSFVGSMGHVVYVEEWYANGTVLVSEMNFVGLGKRSTRVTSESEFKYIYEKA